VRLLGGVLGDAEVFGFFDGVLDLDFDSDSVDENHPDDRDDAEGVGFFDGVLGSKFDPDSDNEGHPDDEDSAADEDDDDEVSGAGRFRVTLRGALGGVDGFAVRLLEGVLGDTAGVFGFFDGVLGSDLNSNPENEDHPDDEVEEDDDDEEDDDEDDDDEDDDDEDDEDDDDGEDEEDDDELSGAGRFGAPLRGALGGVDVLIVRLLEGVLGDGEIFCFFDGVLGPSSSSSSSSSLPDVVNETFFLSQRLRLLPLDSESLERSTVGVLPFNSSVRKSTIAVS
jgi:hypothetical protein